MCEDVALLNEWEWTRFAPITCGVPRCNEELVAAFYGIPKPTDAAVVFLRIGNGASVGREADDAVVIGQVHRSDLFGPHHLGAGVAQFHEPGFVAVQSGRLVRLAPLVRFAAEVQSIFADTRGGSGLQSGEAQWADLPVTVIFIHVQL